MNLYSGPTILKEIRTGQGGHNAVVNFDGGDYPVIHRHDDNNNGKSKSRMGRISWFNG
jgi:hypothetical protein